MIKNVCIDDLTGICHGLKTFHKYKVLQVKNSIMLRYIRIFKINTGYK